MILVINMAFSTPSVKAATLAPTAPETACPAAIKLAALTVEATKGNGMLADAAFRARAAATAPAPKVTPLRIRQRASMARPRTSLTLKAPRLQPNSLEAASAVFPSRSQRTMAARYLSGRACNSWSSNSCRCRSWSSGWRTCSAPASLSFLCRRFRMACAFSAALRATP